MLKRKMPKDYQGNCATERRVLLSSSNLLNKTKVTLGDLRILLNLQKLYELRNNKRYIHSYVGRLSPLTVSGREQW